MTHADIESRINWPAFNAAMAIEREKEQARADRLAFEFQMQEEARRRRVQRHPARPRMLPGALIFIATGCIALFAAPALAASVLCLALMGLYLKTVAGWLLNPIRRAAGRR